MTIKKIKLSNMKKEFSTMPFTYSSKEKRYSQKYSNKLRKGTG